MDNIILESKIQLLDYKIEFDAAVCNIGWRWYKQGRGSLADCFQRARVALCDYVEEREKQFVPPPEPDDLATQVKKAIAKLAAARKGLRN